MQKQTWDNNYNALGKTYKCEYEIFIPRKIHVCALHEKGLLVTFTNIKFGICDKLIHHKKALHALSNVHQIIQKNIVSARWLNYAELMNGIPAATSHFYVFAVGFWHATLTVCKKKNWLSFKSIFIQFRQIPNKLNHARINRQAPDSTKKPLHAKLLKIKSINNKCKQLNSMPFEGETGILWFFWVWVE